MRVENTNLTQIKSEAQCSNQIKEHFNSFRKLFIDASELKNSNLASRNNHFVQDIKSERDFFTSYLNSLDTSDPTLTFKDQVILSRIIELIDQLVAKLEVKADVNFKLETLQLYLIEAFFFHPTQTQTDLLHLGQTSALFTAIFSNADLKLSLPTLEDAQNDPKAFAESIEKQSAICSLFHELMPHQPTKGEKSQVSILHQDLFQATFLAKMVLNQIQYGKEDQVKGSTSQLYDAYFLFLNHLTLT